MDAEDDAISRAYDAMYGEPEEPECSCGGPLSPRNAYGVCARCVALIEGDEAADYERDVAEVDDAAE